ncbi:MAG: GTP cyclohydrolase I FolE2 [Planctomycetes bacterium]|nr:GTP cyclohydrolase I FolE2 [Planctomycetota bacterium]
MPDVAQSRIGAHVRGRLDRVGMGQIEVPVRLIDAEGVERLIPARAEAYVNLADPESKGIHMSRLFLRLQEGLAAGPLSLQVIRAVLESMWDSHADLSDEAHLSLEFDWMVRRAALVSANAGWRIYPVRVEASLTPRGLRLRLGATITYSSTCPCSAALARQLIQEAFDRRFADGSLSADEVRAWLGTPEAICATPHSQRSLAEVLVEVAGADEAPSFAELINQVEESLGTVVQAAVKREDEQAFALVNGQNTMFCEDAARRIKTRLDQEPRIVDYRVQCTHQESLHPHDAVSVVTKGVPGGLRP